MSAATKKTPSNSQLFPTWERNLKIGAIIALAAVVVAGYRYWRAQQPAPAVAVSDFKLATLWTPGAGLNLSPAISRDGKLVAYASDGDVSGNLSIRIRAFHSPSSRRLTDSAFNETDPDFPPDGRQIVFRSDQDGGGIYIAPVDGGGARLAAKEAWRPKYSPDGKWIAFCRLTGSEDIGSAFGVGQVFVVPAEGGEPRRIRPDFPFARYPIWAPDGRHLMFVGTRGDGAKDWWVTPLDSGKAVRTHAVDWLNRAVRAAGMPEQWRGNRILFPGAEENVTHIWEAPISLASWQVTGPPRRLTDGPRMEQQSTASPDGGLLFAGLVQSIDAYILPIEPNEARALGELQAVTHIRGKVQLPFLAAEGSKMIYVSDKSGMRDLWVSDLERKTEEAVTSFREIGFRPVISADGNRVLYPASINGKCAVMTQPATMTSLPQTLQGCFAVWDWSPDGASLLTFRSTGEMNRLELMRLPSQERTPVLAHSNRNFYGVRFSPDARWIAFASGMSTGQARLFIAPLRSPAAGESEWISMGPDNGGEPAWSPDGNMLYFRSKRDGFHCIWARRLGVGKKPEGEPIPIQHFHSAAFGLYLLKPAEFNLTVGRDRLALNAAKASANLWWIRP